MKVVLTWSLGVISAVFACVLTLFVSTHGTYTVAPLVTEDSTLPAQTVAGVRLHMQIEAGPPGARTIVVLHGGAGGVFRSLLGLSAL